MSINSYKFIKVRNASGLLKTVTLLVIYDILNEDM